MLYVYVTRKNKHSLLFMRSDSELLAVTYVNYKIYVYEHACAYTKNSCAAQSEACLEGGNEPRAEIRGRRRQARLRHQR